jgi:hypothetical protein
MSQHGSLLYKVTPQISVENVAQTSCLQARRPALPQITEGLLPKLALSLPDIPRCVETRSMLLSGRCELFGVDETGTLSFAVSTGIAMDVILTVAF